MGTLSKTIIYCRVSSREQEETGYSLPSQEKLLTEYADRKNLKVVKKFSISESASGRHQREAFKGMLGYARKNNVKVIICEKVDRLTRSFRDAVLIDDWLEEDEEREAHLVKDSLVLHRNSRSQEKLNWGVRILFAKNYIDNLSEEVKKGQKEKIAQGWLPTKPPLGYQTIGEKGHKIHVVDESAASYIRQMFELYASGNYSTRGLARELYARGFRTRGGNRLARSRVHELLSEPFYYGAMRWKGQIYKGKHEALISKDLFDTVQRLMTRKIRGSSLTRHNPLFRGKMNCKHCKGRVTWELQKGHWYGHCNNHGISKRCPGKQYIRQELVEEELLKHVERMAPRCKQVLGWIEDVIRTVHSDRVSEREQQVSRLCANLEQIQRRKDAIYEDKLDGEIDRQYYQRKFSEYSEEESALEDALAKVRDHSDEYQALGVAIHELAHKSKEIYEKATIDEKRMLLSYLFTNVLQDGLEVRPEYTLAAKYLTDWVPVINRGYEPRETRTKTSRNGSVATKSKPLLAWQDMLRTMSWEEVFPHPSVSLNQINQLLTVAD